MNATRTADPGVRVRFACKSAPATGVQFIRQIAQFSAVAKHTHAQ
jgi:hypothetical protein